MVTRPSNISVWLPPILFHRVNRLAGKELARMEIIRLSNNVIKNNGTQFKSVQFAIRVLPQLHVTLLSIDIQSENISPSDLGFCDDRRYQEISAAKRNAWNITSFKKHRHAMHARVIFGGWWITWNIINDIYILTKGKKSINAEKNENVELTHK